MKDLDMQQAEQTETSETKIGRPTLGRVIQSTLAGALGVQSSKNREKDFANGNIWVFVVSGIIFTLLFIATVMTLVKLAIANLG